MKNDDVLTYDLIGTRAMNAVRNFNEGWGEPFWHEPPKRKILTIGDLKSTPDAVLLRQVNFGRKSLSELKKALGTSRIPDNFLPRGHA